jgi:hypothetical protein
MCGLARLKRRAAPEILSEVLKKEWDSWTSGSVLCESYDLRRSCIIDIYQAKRKEFADWVRERDTVVKS